MLHILGDNGDNPQISMTGRPDGTWRIIITGVKDALILPSGQDFCPDSDEPVKCPYCKKPR
jgi:hypothetical protein